MLSKLRSFITKYWDVLSYLFFGGLTTAVNWIVYFPLTEWLSWPAGISTAVSWSAAVAFAFLTNKPFVFKSHDWSAKVVFPELVKFVGCRIGSGVTEMVLMSVCVDWLAWHNLLMKVLTSILVVILNYVGSKLFVFKKR